MAGLLHTYDGRRMRIVQGNLLDPTSVTNLNQSWYFLDGCTPFTVTIDGAFTGTVTILGTDLAVAPAGSDNNHSILGQYTSADSYTIDRPYQWVKATATLTGGGPVSVSLLARERAGVRTA